MSVNEWVRARVATGRVHLDVAACGRVSQAVLDAQAAHLQVEAEAGGYVAEAAAAARLDEGRAALGSMVGLDGTALAWADSGATAFATVIDAWPLPAGARVGYLPSEYGGNARVLRDRAPRRGWELVPVPVDGAGRVGELPSGLDLLTFPHIPSQRGVVQPAADALAAGVPVVLDVAQSLGQTDVPPGAAAYVGTSRKWLCGPRGVGFLAVDPAWHDRLAPPPTLFGIELAGMRRFDPPEANVAGRLGLSLAARTFSPALLPVVQAGAAAARVLLQGAGGWQVVEDVAEPSGITTLGHPDADAAAVRAALVERGFVLSVVPTTRADDVTAPVLRVSTAAWVTPGDLEGLAAALEAVTSQ